MNFKKWRNYQNTKKHLKDGLMLSVQCSNLSSNFNFNIVISENLNGFFNFLSSRFLHFG